MRLIPAVCVSVCVAGCELYFGPAQDAAPPALASDAGGEPDAATGPVGPPDPPATCSNIQVYLQVDPADPRGPFVAAKIKDALAYYHVPITTTPPATPGLSMTIALAPHASTAVQVPVSCMPQHGATATIADGGGRSNEEIVANALHGLGVLYSFPPMVNAGDCMADPVVPGCTFGRATTAASDPCGYWHYGPIDEAQMLATDLGCPGVGP